MSALGSKLRSLAGGSVAFWCPGCNEAHMIRVDGSKRPSWSFNGNGDAPTFKPSVLLKTGHHVTGHKGDCWCSTTDENDEPWPFGCVVCHSFVTDGRIQFLSDCTHALAGQTVDIPDFPKPEA
ncbi:ammonia monooxygenase [Sulfitobacter sp. EhC04]|uniref:DUF6527 family protein n=1 Tax=Sulfitobacter sp. EhC04 TaxID=1849168 RepID=UPI0007F4C542|nr:DUF6527 family protein [Sulfitobacter sp. EhC04]OAN71573.1 ammonia monooxygenase [Sulfitobacter sp. EhC04]